MNTITIFVAGLFHAGYGNTVQIRERIQDDRDPLTSLAMFLVAGHRDTPLQSIHHSRRTQSSIRRSLSPLLELRGGGTAVIKEKRTGIGFAEKGEGGTLTKLGVRTKGPIKVYAVGEYSNDVFVLKMSFGVSASKMSSALADALKPRCSNEKLVSEFKACLTKGLPNGAPKGTEMVFSTGGGKLAAKVNGKSVCDIASKDLAKAFANIYRDGKAVCKMIAVE
mmetsp:Transcript_56163/g.87463  ORF Transcript_56163/g.87463 Transcript_56163/m.87463 type:complete len:222 (-) Transcript_56163:17-682(-)